MYPSKHIAHNQTDDFTSYNETIYNLLITPLHLINSPTNAACHPTIITTTRTKLTPSLRVSHEARPLLVRRAVHGDVVEWTRGPLAVARYLARDEGTQVGAAVVPPRQR